MQQKEGSSCENMAGQPQCTNIVAEEKALTQRPESYISHERKCVKKEKEKPENQTQ